MGIENEEYRPRALGRIVSEEIVRGPLGKFCITKFPVVGEALVLVPEDELLSSGVTLEKDGYFWAKINPGATHGRDVKPSHLEPYVDGPVTAIDLNTPGEV